MWVQKGGVIVANPYKNSAWLKIRLSPIHNEMLEQICDVIGINKSEFVRFCIAYWHANMGDLMTDEKANKDVNDLITYYLELYMEEYEKKSNFSELAKPLLDRLNNGDQSALDELNELAKKQSGK